MSRFKPTPKLDVIGNLALKPEKVSGNFAESRLQNKLYVKPPNWDSCGDGVELLAIQNDREYIAMLQLQVDMIENSKRQNVVCTNRIDQLYKMQTNIRKRFIEANNFFKDCDDKKRNAEIKVSEEKQVHAELKQVIQTYKSNIDILTEFRNVLMKTVKEFEPYEVVINQCVAEDNFWTSIKDCTDRCDALMITQVQINKTKKEKLQEIEDLRLKMVKLTNEAALTLLGLNNELSELERAYAQAHSECLKWEKILANVKKCYLGNALMKNRILAEIQIMYRKLCKRRGIFPILQKFDIEGQMNFIKDEIEIIQAVVKKCNEK